MAEVLRQKSDLAEFEDCGARLVALEGELRAQREMLEDMRRVTYEIRQLVGPCGIPVTSSELLVQTLFGVKFYVPADDQIMTPQLVVYRQWEAKLSELMLYIATQISVFVDVGANFGYFTCIMANALGSVAGSRVIAVYPNPHMLRLLSINTRINWSLAPVRIVPVALAEAPGSSVLYLPALAPANAGLASPGEGRPTWPDESAEQPMQVDVESRRLDDVLRDEPRVDLIKIDVEGFETAVLRGGSQTLQRPGLRIIFEWGQEQMRVARFNPTELLAVMRQYGFRLFDAETWLHLREHAELTDAALLSISYCNVLALRDS